MDRKWWRKRYLFDLLGRRISLHALVLHKELHALADAKWPPNVAGSLNALDKCAVCKGANLICMVWNFKGISCCNCLTRESINHCSLRSSCNFFPNAGIYFPTILFFFSFNLARSFERLIATIFKNNKLVSHVATQRQRNNIESALCPPHTHTRKYNKIQHFVVKVSNICYCCTC